MTAEDFFTAALSAIGLFVLTTILTGCVLWVRWFYFQSQFNVTGDSSDELLTRESYAVPSLYGYEFLLTFILMIGIGNGMVILFAPTPEVEAVAEVDGSVDDNPSPMTEPDPVTESDPVPESDPVTELATPNEDGTSQSATAAEATSDESSTEDANEEEEAAKPPAVSSHDMIMIHAISSVGALVFMLVLLRVANGTTATQMGLRPSWPDVRRGMIATVWILSPVLLINIVVAQLVRYEHAVTDLIAEDTQTQTFLFVFFTAAVITPIFEEFLFRFLLQGFLQKVADPVMDLESAKSWRPRAVWPIVVTSIVFALMHLGQGAAPIPLFFLSIGLGFLYQATGRLTPVIVVHMLLNGTTLLMEFCRVNSGIELPS